MSTRIPRRRPGGDLDAAACTETRVPRGRLDDDQKVPEPGTSVTGRKTFPLFRTGGGWCPAQMQPCADESPRGCVNAAPRPDMRAAACVLVVVPAGSTIGYHRNQVVSTWASGCAELADAGKLTDWLAAHCRDRTGVTAAGGDPGHPAITAATQMTSPRTTTMTGSRMLTL